jgi:signal transduction histidine kinase
MTTPPLPPAVAEANAPAHGPRSVLVEFTWRRVGLALALAVAAALLLNQHFLTPFVVLLGRMLVIALLLLIAFVAAGRVSPRTLPDWLPPWLLRVAAVMLAAPVATYLVYLPSVDGDFFGVFAHPGRMAGFVLITGAVLVVAPVLALGALYRERDAQARSQALRFALERSRLEQQRLDAELRLLQAQIQPHFLFNTLANVQALVESGSPRAAPVLQQLITYLGSAVPRLGAAAATLDNEATLVRAYLELMHMRMPDRLRFSIDVPAALGALPFTPMALLTLVENAVRHGIDPTEDGGAIDVRAWREPGRLCVEVADTGAGLTASAADGTGLANLRARLAGGWGAGATLTLAPNAPRGVRACITLPSTA